jgi:hypothetical protein
MGSGIRHTPGVLSWDQGQYTHYRIVVMGSETIHTRGLLSWDQRLEKLQECCHGIRDNTHHRIVVMGSGIRHTSGICSRDEDSRRVVMGSGTITFQACCQGIRDETITLQACCHGFRDKTRAKDMLPWDQGQNTLPGMLSWDRGQKHSVGEYC